MGKKKNKGNGANTNNNNNNSNNGGNEESNNGENKEDNNNNNNTLILKVHMHCDACAAKITKYLDSIKGVETVKTESETGKVTVVGKVDPIKVRDNLAEKIKKKVELISPQPKKEKENNNNNNNKENGPNNNKSDENKIDDKKELITTSVLKMVLHCQGCIDKIGKIVLKTKGVLDMKIDKEKDNVTVKGTMDVKGLVDNLSEKLKRKVEVVPPKKDKEGSGGGGGGGENEGGGGKKKNKGCGGGGGGEGGDNEGEVKMMEHFVQVQPPFGYGYGNVEGYNGQVYQELIHYHMHSQPPQMFSDENPNACIVM